MITDSEINKIEQDLLEMLKFSPIEKEDIFGYFAQLRQRNQIQKGLIK